MSETIFYEQSPVQVTNRRFIVNNITYPINQITSVKMTTLKEPKKWNKTYFIMALLLSFFPCLGLTAVIVGIFNGRINEAQSNPMAIFILLFIAFLAYSVFSAAKPKKGLYVINMSVASGEVDAYSSNDKTEIEKIVSAINNAIVGSQSVEQTLPQTIQNTLDPTPLNIQDELQKLANMKERGLIDDEEFKTLKKKLIDKA